MKYPRLNLVGLFFLLIFVETRTIMETFMTIQDYLDSIEQPKEKYITINDMYAIEFPKLVGGDYWDQGLIITLNKTKTDTVSLGSYSHKLKYNPFIRFYENHVSRIPDFTIGEYGGASGIGVDPNDPKYKGRKIHDNREYKNLYKGLYDIVNYI